jgi:hypothetical protein
VNTYEITAPDGRKFRVTGPGTREEALAQVQASYKPRGPVQQIDVDPTKGMSTSDKFFAGVGKGMTDVVRGVGQAVGLVDQSEIDESKKRDAALMNTTAGTVGNIAGTVAATAPTMLIPGANTVAGSAAIGAATGALAPVASDESRGMNTVLGGAGGAAGALVGKALPRVAAPIEQSGPVKKLLAEGVVPTPGQAAGADSLFGRVEQKLQSLPLIGDIIKKGRDRATEELNVAAIRRALPVNARGQITAAGREAIEKADDILGSGYDAVYAQIKVKPDTQFLRDAIQVKNDPDLALPKELQARLGEIVRSQVLDRVKAGEIAGPLAQRIDSNLGTLSRRYLSTPDADQRVLGLALREVQKSFKALVERNAGPDAADTIRELNKSYANFLRVERAAAMQGARDGVFSADQLSSAVRALDRSGNKGSFARGAAPMQDLSDAAKTTMGGTVPNSGSADRALMALGAAGAGGAADAVIGGPGFLSLLAASPVMYSRSGSRYMLGDLSGQQATSQAIKRLSPYFALTGRTAGQ